MIIRSTEEPVVNMHSEKLQLRGFEDTLWAIEYRNTEGKISHSMITKNEPTVRKRVAVVYYTTKGPGAANRAESELRMKMKSEGAPEVAEVFSVDSDLADHLSELRAEWWVTEL